MRAKRSATIRPTLLACVVVAALYTCHLVLVHSSRASASVSLHRVFLEAVPTATLRNSDGLNVSRSAAAAQLEKHIDSDPMLGACLEQEPLLQGMAVSMCKNLRCLWSEIQQSNVDLWLSPLRLLSSDAMPTTCPLPQGGQQPIAEGKKPVVSFVVSMHNGGQVTAQCLLELFRTAREVDSAEYILVNDGSTEDVSAAVQVCWRNVAT